MAENGYGPVAGHTGRIPNFSRQTVPSQQMYEAPACIQNAMMTKDKKPFTYTPGGLDLSQIKTPSMARRLNRHEDDEQRYPVEYNNMSAGGPPKPPPPPPQQGPAPPPPPPLVIQAPRNKSPKPPAQGERPEIVIPENPIGMLRRTNSPYHWESEKAEREKQGAKFVEKAASPSFQQQNTLAPTSFTQNPPATYSSPQRNNEVNRVPESPVHRPEPQYSNQMSRPYQPPNPSPAASNYSQDSWKPIEQPKPQPQTYTNQYQIPYNQPNQTYTDRQYNDQNSRQQPAAPPSPQYNQTQLRQLMSPPPVLPKPNLNQGYQQNSRQLMSPPTVQSNPNQFYQATSRSLMSPPTVQNQRPLVAPRQTISHPAQNNPVHFNPPNRPEAQYQRQVKPEMYQYSTAQGAPTHDIQNAPNAWKNQKQQSLDDGKPYCGIGTNPWKQQDIQKGNQTEPQSRPVPIQIQNSNQNTYRQPEPTKPQNNHVSWKQPEQETKTIAQNQTSSPHNVVYLNKDMSKTPTNQYNSREVDNSHAPWRGNSVPRQDDRNYQYQNGNQRNVQPENVYLNNVKPAQNTNQNREVVYVTQEPVYYNNPGQTVPPPFIKQKQRTPPPEWVHIADSRRSVPKETPSQKSRPEPEWVSKTNELKKSIPRNLTSPPPQNTQPVWSTKPSVNLKSEPESNVRILPIQMEQYGTDLRNHNQQPTLRIVIDHRRPQQNDKPTDLLLSRVTSPHMVRLDDIMPAGKTTTEQSFNVNHSQTKTRIIPIQIESNNNSAKQVYVQKYTNEAPRQSKAFRVLQTITGTCDELADIFSGLPYTDF